MHTKLLVADADAGFLPSCFERGGSIISEQISFFLLQKTNRESDNNDCDHMDSHYICIV